MKGIVFTLEALITFSFFIIVLTGAMVLVQPSQPTIPFSEAVFLNDVYQVLELKYHGQVAEFIISKGKSVPIGLADFLGSLENQTGKKVFLEYKERTAECDSILQMNRLFAFPDLSYNSSSKLVDVNYFHQIKIGICK